MMMQARSLQIIFVQIIFAILLNLAAMLSGVAQQTSHAAEPEFLSPDLAFKASVKRVADNRLELQYDIADGYYLYRDAFLFESLEPHIVLGEAALPAPQIKFDPNFNKNMEIYHGRLLISLPISGPSLNSAFYLRVQSRGCADAGLCYAPQQNKILVAAAQSVNQADDLRLADFLATRSLWLSTALFFGLGALLAFTPCVLPLLPILASMLLKQGTLSRRRSFLISLLYVLGMSVVYTAIGVAAGLSGQGLSMALQSPWMLLTFSILLIVFALSMFDLFHLQLPAAWQAKLSHITHHHIGQRAIGNSLLGALLMGMLSALIVGPCVAPPLAGALLYISQSREALRGGLTLFSMAWGMGLPLLLVGISAGALLPYLSASKFGVWMVRAKRFVGLLLFMLAAWTIYPLLNQQGLEALFQGRSGLSPSAGSKPSLKSLAGENIRTSENISYAGLPFVRVKTLAALQEQIENPGQAVLLDFYADWCVACKEMEAFTLRDPSVRERLQQFKLIQVDVTANTPDDQALLKQFNLFGPPGIIFFDRQGQLIPTERVVGFQKPGRFRLTLERVLDRRF